MFVHLHGEEVAHLSITGCDVLKECQVADYILQLLAVFEVIHDDADSSLVLTGQLDAAVLDLMVVHYKGAHLGLEQHSEG